ncbi:uncharacterized protein LOC135489468 [Lineus longissimus]|uniref:uncharacterized protein LOC135489468 n=1 Tax=Lineus longissimus TaxID=88925 RepID=UPI002B4D80D2
MELIHINDTGNHTETAHLTGLKTSWPDFHGFVDLPSDTGELSYVKLIVPSGSGAQYAFREVTVQCGGCSMPDIHRFPCPTYTCLFGADEPQGTYPYSSSITLAAGTSGEGSFKYQVYIYGGLHSGNGPSISAQVTLYDGRTSCGPQIFYNESAAGQYALQGRVAASAFADNYFMMNCGYLSEVTAIKLELNSFGKQYQIRKVSVKNIIYYGFMYYFPTNCNEFNYCYIAKYKNSQNDISQTLGAGVPQTPQPTTGVPASTLPTGVPASTLPTGVPASTLPTGVPASTAPSCIQPSGIPASVPSRTNATVSFYSIDSRSDTCIVFKLDPEVPFVSDILAEYSIHDGEEVNRIKCARECHSDPDCEAMAVAFNTIGGNALACSRYSLSCLTGQMGL